MRTLGTLTLTVSIDARGKIDVAHRTNFEEALRVMQGAMSPDEIMHAVKLRKAVCQHAARFFTFVSDPDARLVIMER